MSLRIATPATKIEKNLATALRDAMDDPCFSYMNFHIYSHDDETDEIDDSEQVTTIQRPASVDEIPTIAREKAQELVAIKFRDKSIQGYESVVCTIKGKDADGVEYDMSEPIIGDGDGYEWEIEYMPD